MGMGNLRWFGVATTLLAYPACEGVSLTMSKSFSPRGSPGGSTIADEIEGMEGLWSDTSDPFQMNLTPGHVDVPILPLSLVASGSYTGAMRVPRLSRDISSASGSSNSYISDTESESEEEYIWGETPDDLTMKLENSSTGSSSSSSGTSGTPPLPALPHTSSRRRRYSKASDVRVIYQSPPNGGQSEIITEFSMQKSEAQEITVADFINRSEEVLGQGELEGYNRNDHVLKLSINQVPELSSGTICNRRLYEILSSESFNHSGFMDDSGFQGHLMNLYVVTEFEPRSNVKVTLRKQDSGSGSSSSSSAPAQPELITSFSMSSIEAERITIPDFLARAERALQNSLPDYNIVHHVLKWRIGTTSLSAAIERLGTAEASNTRLLDILSSSDILQSRDKGLDSGSPYFMNLNVIVAVERRNEVLDRNTAAQAAVDAVPAPRATQTHRNAVQEGDPVLRFYRRHLNNRPMRYLATAAATACIAGNCIGAAHHNYGILNPPQYRYYNPKEYAAQQPWKSSGLPGYGPGSEECYRPTTLKEILEEENGVGCFIGYHMNQEWGSPCCPPRGSLTEMIV